MRWRLLGRIPVMSASGTDVDRSAAGRVALDATLVPPAFLDPTVSWRQGTDADTVSADGPSVTRSCNPSYTSGMTAAWRR
jgi:Family of unknown function (DUF6544)